MKRWPVTVTELTSRSMKTIPSRYWMMVAAFRSAFRRKRYSCGRGCIYDPSCRRQVRRWGYKVSGGLHGVGASVVNALSTWLEVRVYQDGKIYQQRYERGKVMYPLKVVGECMRTNTEPRFISCRTRRSLRRPSMISISFVSVFRRRRS